jgi:hypothetical protein
MSAMHPPIAPVDDQLDTADERNHHDDRRPARDFEQATQLGDLLHRRMAKLTIETRTPRLSAARRGADEKLITPVVAKRSIFLSGYLVSPAKRSCRR